MYASRYFAARYFAPRYFPRQGSVALTAPHYFPHGYFAGRYFPQRYFPGASVSVIPPPEPEVVPIAFRAHVRPGIAPVHVVADLVLPFPRARARVRVDPAAIAIGVDVTLPSRPTVEARIDAMPAAIAVAVDLGLQPSGSVVDLQIASPPTHVRRARADEDDLDEWFYQSAVGLMRDES